MAMEHNERRAGSYGRPAVLNHCRPQSVLNALTVLNCRSNGAVKRTHPFWKGPAGLMGAPCPDWLRHARDAEGCSHAWNRRRGMRTADLFAVPFGAESGTARGIGRPRAPSRVAREERLGLAVPTAARPSGLDTHVLRTRHTRACSGKPAVHVARKSTRRALSQPARCRPARPPDGNLRKWMSRMS